MRAFQLSLALSLFAAALSGCIAFVDPDQGCARDADCATGSRCDPGLHACVGRATDAAGSTTAGTSASAATASGTSNGAGSTSGVVSATASSGTGSITGSAGSTSGVGSSGGTAAASGSSGGTGTTCSDANPCPAPPPCQDVVCNPGSHSCDYSSVADGTDCGAGRVCTAGTCLCPSGQTDCGGTCIDLRTDANNCGACGTACANGSPCQNGACKSFFGAFENSSTCGGTTTFCARGNPELGSTQCGCPGLATTAQEDANLLTDIDRGIGLEPSGTLGVCTGAAPSDFGGMYSTGPACGGDGCIAHNPLAGAQCACPNEYVPISLSVGHACSGCGEPLHPDPGTIVLCWNPAAPLTSFGGAFELDDPGDGGCRVTNPATGDCSCPASTGVHPLRVLDTFPDGGWIGATIGICSVP